MKIILSITLIFLFSTHSFSGKLDGKEIYCKLKTVHKYNSKRINCDEAKFEIDYNSSCTPKRLELYHWFKGGSVVIPYLDSKDEINPKIKTDKAKYTETADWIFYNYFSLNRKTLELFDGGWDKEGDGVTFNHLDSNVPHVKWTLKKFTWACEVKKYSKEDMYQIFQSEIKRILDRQKGNKI